jgi:WD40 repeat protein
MSALRWQCRDPPAHSPVLNFSLFAARESLICDDMTAANTANRTPFSPGSQPPQPPPEIPNYQMLRSIGSGSYGEVWLAQDVMGIFRAVKVVRRDRFKEDARPYDREFDGICHFEPVSHFPSQVNISNVGRNDRDGYFYYVMELADDQHSGPQVDPTNYEPKTLRSELKERGRLPFNECLDLGLALTAALSHLHNHGLVHRDIKAANVIYVRGLAKLADIGLVAAAEVECSFVGTEGYVPPEGPGGVQADIYALGKVLYRMSTGQDAADYPSLPSGEILKPELQELNQVVNRACEANATRRYKTMEEMADDLRLLKSRKSLVRVRRLERTVRLALLSAAVLFSVVILGGLIAASIVYGLKRENRMHELRELKLAGTGPRHVSGWFTTNWPRLKRAAAIRKDAEVLEQGVAMLAGLDAHPVKVHWDAVGSSAAFSKQGEALVGGTDNGPALLLDTNGIKTELPARGEGPVCWAPDGAPMQFVALTNILALRDARTGAVRWRVPYDKAYSTGDPPVLAVMTDGSRVAAGLGNHVKTWNTATGDCLGETEGDASRLEFSTDGSLLALGMKDGTTRIVAVPGMEPTTTLPPALRGGPIQALAFARDPLVRSGPEGRSNSWLLAVADAGTSIVVWDLGRRLPHSFFRGSGWNVQSLAFDPQGITLASAGRQEARLWDVVSGRLLLLLHGDSGSDCRALAFSAEGNRVLHGCVRDSSRAAVGLWELDPPRGVQGLRGLAAPIHQIWFSPDTRWIAALSDDWQVAIWDAPRGRLRFLLEVPPGVLADMAGGCFDSRAEKFAYASWHQACLYDMATGKTLRRWPLPDGFWDQLQFDATGRLLLLRRERPSTDRATRWRLYQLGDSETPTLLYEQSDRSWRTFGLALAPGGRRFLASDTVGSPTNCVLRVYDTEGRELWRASSPYCGSGLNVRLDPSGRRFAYLDSRSPGRFTLMDFEDFKEVSTLPADCSALSPTGQGLDHKGWIYLDHFKRDKMLPMVTTDWTRNYMFCFSPDGKFVAQATEEGVLVLSEIAEVTRRLSEL